MKKLLAVGAAITLVSFWGIHAGSKGSKHHGHCNHDHGAAKTEAVEAKAQTTCPVMGGKINKNVYADYEGKRVYFCCAGCDKTFNKNPEKYLKKLSNMGQTPASVPQETSLAPQSTCPVMGGKINKSQYAEVEGKRVYVCCAGCIAQIEKNPSKYLKKLSEMGQAPETI